MAVRKWLAGTSLSFSGGCRTGLTSPCFSCDSWSQVWSCAGTITAYIRRGNIMCNGRNNRGRTEWLEKWCIGLAEGWYPPVRGKLWLAASKPVYPTFYQKRTKGLSAARIALPAAPEYRSPLWPIVWLDPEWATHRNGRSMHGDVPPPTPGGPRYSPHVRWRREFPTPGSKSEFSLSVLTATGFEISPVIHSVNEPPACSLSLTRDPLALRSRSPTLACEVLASHSSS